MLGTTSRGVAPAAEQRVPTLGVRTTQSGGPTSGASGKATRAALSSGLPESGVELSGRYILPFAKKANDEALGAALQTMSLMVPSPFSAETSPGVAAEIRQRTPWAIATPGRADAIVRGRILTVGEAPLSETRDDLVLESSVVVTAEIELVDRIDGVLLQRAQRTSSVAYLVARGESLETALDRSLAELAEDLIQALEQWSRSAESNHDTEHDAEE